MKTYDVHVTREGKWWMVQIPELDALTQARRLNEVPVMARDLIAITLDVPEDSFDLTTRIVLPADVKRHLERARELREQSNRANTQAAAEARQAARELHEAGVPLRDVGEVLGVSYQRAHQLVS